MQIHAGHNARFLLVLALVVAFPLLSVLACPCPQPCTACITPADAPSPAACCDVTTQPTPHAVPSVQANNAPAGCSQGVDHNGVCLHALDDPVMIAGVLHNPPVPAFCFVAASFPVANNAFSDRLHAHDATTGLPPPGSTPRHLSYCLLLC